MRKPPLTLIVAGLLLSQAEAFPALILNYTFDESSSGAGTAFDVSGFGTAANGSFFGDATRITSTPGPGGSTAALDLSVNANQDDVRATDPSKLNNLTQYTLSTWINLRAAPVVNDRIISKWLTASGPGFDWRFVSTGGQLALANNNSVAGGSGNISTAPGWQFIAVTWSGTEVRYWRGTESVSVSQLGGTVSFSTAPGTSTADFRVGSTAATAADRTPSAWFDDVRVYDTALSSAQLEVVRLTTLPEPGTATLFAAAILAWLGRRTRRV